MIEATFINWVLGYTLGMCAMFLLGVGISKTKMKDYKDQRWYALIFGSVVWPIFGGFWLALKFWDVISSNTLKDILFYEIMSKKVGPDIWNPSHNEETRDRANERAFGPEPFDASVTEPIDAEFTDHGNSSEGTPEKKPIIVIGVKCGSKLR